MADFFPITLFGSMRFDGTQKDEGLALKKALARFGINLFVAAPGLGDSIDLVVYEQMENSDGFVVFGTSNYAADTGNTASTFKELSYWQNRLAKKKPDRLFPLNMLRDGEEEHEHIMARVLFNTNDAWAHWPKGTPLPDKVVQGILAKFGLSQASADDSTAATLFDMLDSNHNGVISKMELIDFCSTQSVSNAKLTKALGLSGKYQVTRSEFYAAHRSGAIDFLNGIADIGLTRRNSQMESLGAGVQQMAVTQQHLVFSSYTDRVAVGEGGALVTNTGDS